MNLSLKSPIGSLIDGARRGKESRSRGTEIAAITGGAYGGGYAGNTRMLGYGSEGIDYNAEAGLRWDNSIVYSILSFFITCCNGTPLMVARKDAAGKLIPVPNHPVTALLAKPNPWYDGSLLQSCQVFEESARGNSYVYKHRNPNTNELIAFEYLPEGTCFPYTWPGSGEWVSEYRIATATGYFRVPPCDVLHMRWMTCNPFWPVIGMAPLDSGLPDLVADKVASRHEAMIIKNSGVSAVSVAPMPARAGELQPIFDKEQRLQLRDDIEDKITGDNKGRPMIWKLPVDYRQIGFDPKQLLLNEVRWMAETRLCAIYHVHPAVMGLWIGLEKGSNRATMQAAINSTVDFGVLPYMRHRAQQLSEDLGQDGEMMLARRQQIMYDESQIPNLKERLFQELIEWSGGPIYTLNEARAEVSLGPVADGDKVRGGSAKEEAQEDKPDSSDSSTEKVSDADGNSQGGKGDKVGADSGSGGG